MLVLGGALAAGHRHRVYDAVMLKTLGATRMRLLARLCDRISRCSGSPPRSSASPPGSAAAAFVVTPGHEPAVHLAARPAAGVLRPAPSSATVVLGLIGTFSRARQKPAPVLRNL